MGVNKGNEVELGKEQEGFKLPRYQSKEIGKRTKVFGKGQLKGAVQNNADRQNLSSGND